MKSSGSWVDNWLQVNIAWIVQIMTVNIAGTGIVGVISQG
jgi:hypothetical protein